MSLDKLLKSTDLAAMVRPGVDRPIAGTPPAAQSPLVQSDKPAPETETFGSTRRFGTITPNGRPRSGK